MRGLVPGGTGSIGAAVVRKLIGSGHAVLGLARSEVSATKLAGLGATPLHGDISSPDVWTGQLPQLDAVVHAACDFDSEMAAIERRLLDYLLPALGASSFTPQWSTGPMAAFSVALLATQSSARRFA